MKDRFKSRLTKAQGAAYQGAMEAVLAIPIAVGLGYWADTHFGTSPRYLLVGAVIGFCAFVLRLTRMRPDLDESATDDEDRASADAASDRNEVAPDGTARDTRDTREE